MLARSSDPERHLLRPKHYTQFDFTWMYLDIVVDVVVVVVIVSGLSLRVGAIPETNVS